MNKGGQLLGDSWRRLHRRGEAHRLFGLRQSEGL